MLFANHRQTRSVLVHLGKGHGCRASKLFYKAHKPLLFSPVSCGVTDFCVLAVPSIALDAQEGGCMSWQLIKEH